MDYDPNDKPSEPIIASPPEKDVVDEIIDWPERQSRDD